MLVRTYVKRLRMECSLRQEPGEAVWPQGIDLLPWRPELERAHAEVKYHAFHRTLDASVFPNLGRLEGCRKVMDSITGHNGFLKGATWLAEDGGLPCGCIQGVESEPGLGMVQNLAVVPSWQGCGLGRALLLAALRGFYAAGLRRAMLEVSAKNARAVQLYSSCGFVVVRRSYREIREVSEQYLI
jgi:ribosomal protein S18 acetylase RimI-like enzyme